MIIFSAIKIALDWIMALKMLISFMAAISQKTGSHPQEQYERQKLSHCRAPFDRIRACDILPNKNSP
jgi:hypothetical protein